MPSSLQHLSNNSKRSRRACHEGANNTMSSAYAKILTAMPPMWHPTLLEEISASNGRIYLVNNNGDRMPPCLVPLPKQNGLDWVFNHTTVAC